MSVDINVQSSHGESGVELLSLDSVKSPGTSHDKFKEGFITGSSHREPKDGDIPDPPHRASVEETIPIVESDGQLSATSTHVNVNEIYTATSGQSDEDETSPKTDSMEVMDAENKTSTLQENKPTVKTSNVEIMSNTGSHDRTDHNNPASVEYHYIDDIHDSTYQQAMEESRPEAENDYEFIAETNPGYDYIEPLNDPRTFSARMCKRGIVFLAPIFAGVVVNIMAGFFYTTFLMQIFSWKTSAIFKVVNALAAAACAPLMIRYGFRKVALGGSVLLIFSCIFPSLATRDDIKTLATRDDSKTLATRDDSKTFITLTIMKGFSVGLLRSTGIVATVDHLNTRPALAVIINYFSFFTGHVSSLFNLIRYTIWLEIPAILGLVAALFLQKNSKTHQNVTKLFKHPPFYVLVSITVVSSMGLASVIISVNTITSIAVFYASQVIGLIVLLVIRNFLTVCLKRSSLLSIGLSAVAVGVIATAHKVTHPVFFGVGTGFAFVLSQVMLPIALISTTERSSLKLALPLLCCFQLTGEGFGGAFMVLSQVMLPIAFISTTETSSLNLTLPLLCCFQLTGDDIGDAIMETTVKDTSSDTGAMYFGGVSLIVAGVRAIIAWVLIRRGSRLSDEIADNINDEEGDDPGDGQREDHVEDDVEDHVEVEGEDPRN